MITKTLKASLLATTLSAVALVPVVTVATIATTDAAYANNGNGNGGGGGNGGGNGGGKDSDRGKSSDKKGGGKDKSAKSNGGGNAKAKNTGNGFLKKLFGQQKKETTTVAKQKQIKKAKPSKVISASAPASTPKPAKRPEKMANVNSQLKALNAANANVNAYINASPNSRVGRIAAYRETYLALGVIDAELMRLEDLIPEDYETPAEILTGLGIEDTDAAFAEIALATDGYEPGMPEYDPAYQAALADLLTPEVEEPVEPEVPAEGEEVVEVEEPVEPEEPIDYAAVQMQLEEAEELGELQEAADALDAKKTDLEEQAAMQLADARSPKTEEEDPLSPEALDYFHSLLPSIDELALDEDPLDVSEYVPEEEPIEPVEVTVVE
ncbi:MAG: hypothetical protein KJO15_12385 [Alphaproteobacteria bacterium]|nr:hypothetical protein [Alphaproteobacteria bacterium]